MKDCVAEVQHKSSITDVPDPEGFIQKQRHYRKLYRERKKQSDPQPLDSGVEIGSIAKTEE